MRFFSWQRVYGYMVKESIQMRRDPSCYLIAIVMPVLMIFLFAFGVSLDMKHIKVGLICEDTSPMARSLAAFFENNEYFHVTDGQSREKMYEAITAAKLHGLIVIPQNFSKSVLNQDAAHIQVIADGSETNTASFIQNYSDAIINLWWASYAAFNELPKSTHITPITRIWFNEALDSRRVILPGSMAIIMALIGTLLTALVVAREWDNGTMETVMTTPMTMLELILAKTIPYFLLGILSMILCFCCCVYVFQVPFLGSFWLLLLATALFLVASLGQGLLISTLAKNQFAASQAAINAAFLPAYMLSGFLYEINSMPTAIKAITYLLPARYFVSVIQTSFMAGIVWEPLIKNMVGMLIIGAVFLGLVYRKTEKQVS